MTTRSLGDVVREIREQHRLTQIELAERAQIGISYITMLESGRQHSVPSTILQRLARALSVHVDKLRPT